jgi:hypothetical protein
LQLAFKVVGANFAPALGFVNRTAVRMYDGSLDCIYRFRDLRMLETNTDNTFVTDMSNRFETRRNQLSISFETNLVQCPTGAVPSPCEDTAHGLELCSIIPSNCSLRLA